MDMVRLAYTKCERSEQRPTLQAKLEEPVNWFTP